MTALPRPHLVQIVADDLGYNDLGYFNGGKTITPTIDGLLQGGVFLSNFYAFRVCAPSRASGLSGRYPWGVGFYDMSYDEHHCIDPRFQLLPAGGLCDARRRQMGCRPRRTALHAHLPWV